MNGCRKRRSGRNSVQAGNAVQGSGAANLALNQAVAKYLDQKLQELLESLKAPKVRKNRRTARNVAE